MQKKVSCTQSAVYYIPDPIHEREDFSTRSEWETGTVYKEHGIGSQKHRYF